MPLPVPFSLTGLILGFNVGPGFLHLDQVMHKQYFKKLKSKTVYSSRAFKSGIQYDGQTSLSFMIKFEPDIICFAAWVQARCQTGPELTPGSDPDLGLVQCATIGLVQ